MMRNATQPLDVNRLRERAGVRPRTKIGQVRQVWPEIKKLLNAGHNLTDIWAWLNEIGIEIGYGRLSHCIGQLRLQDRAAQAPIQDLLRGLASVPPERARQEQPAGQSGPPPNEARDPLRNIRERRAKKSGFDYDPFPTKGLTE